MKKILFVLLFLLFPGTVSAATITWDGGGATTNWSEGANWSTDTVPASADTVIFSASSTKNSVIDDSFGGTVSTFTISSGYTGTITQERDLIVNSVFSQADGVFTGSTNAVETLTFNNSFTLSGGVFNAPVSTTTFNNSNFTHTAGGTFNHSTGTAYFGGSGDRTINVASTESFYNLKVETSGTWTINIASGDQLYVYNNLVLTNGIINSSDNNAGITMIGQSGVTTTLTHVSTFDGGTAITTATGTNSMELSLVGDGGDMTGFYLNNPNATATVTGSTSDLRFDGIVTSTQGTFIGPTGGTGLTFALAFNCDGGTFGAGTGTKTFTGAVTISGCDYTSPGGTEAYSSTFSQSAGTWTKDDGDVSYTSTWTLSGGTYAATPNTTTFNNSNFTHTAGGTFNHSTGTAYFGGSGDRTINVASTESFYNLKVETSGTWTINIASGDQLYVYNNLVLTNGIVNSLGSNAGFSMIGQSGVTTTLTHTATFDGGSAITTATGTNPMVLNLVGDGGDMTGLHMNNPNATATVTGTTSDLRFDGISTMAAGTFVGPTSGTGLTFGLTFSCSGGTFGAGTGTKTFTGAVTFSGCDYTSPGGTEAYSSTFSQSAGTWTKDDGDVSYTNSTLTLSGGTYNATPATTTFNTSGAFTHTAGGTFNHSSGTVYITGTGDRTFDVASTENFYNFEVAFTPTWTLNIASGDQLHIFNNLILTDGIVNTGSFVAYGNVTIGTSWNGGSGPLIFGGGDDQTLTVESPAVFNADITVNKTSATDVVTLVGDLTLDASSQDLTIQEGIFDLNGYNLTINGTSGTTIVQDGGTLRMVGGETITANSGYPQFQTGSNAVYTGSGTYTIKDFTYYNLAIEGDGTFTLANNESIGNNVAVSGGTLDLGSYDLTIATGTYSNTGVLQLNGDETLGFSIDPTVGTVEYAGSGSYASLPAGDEYNNLVFSGSGTWTQGAHVTVNGDITITSSTLNSSGYNITLSGDWTNTGTYISGANTTTFNGTNQVITGTTAFNNLVKTTSAEDTLTFGAGQTQTIAGTLTLNGVAGILSLRSTVTGTPWILDTQDTVLAYLDVRDSSNIGTVILAYSFTGITDSGNNSGWTFTLASSGGGSSPPPAPPQAPSASVDNPDGNFMIRLHGGSTTTYNSLITVNLYSGSDTAFMALANDEHFTNSIQQTYRPSILWRLTPGIGEKTVYAKFYTYSGGFSSVVTSTITVLSTHSTLPEPIDQNTGGGATTTPAIPQTPTPVVGLYPPGFGPGTRLSTPGTATPPNSAPNSSLPPLPSFSKTFQPFTRTLTPNTTGADVKQLQIWLNTNGFTISTQGPGSPGNETLFYGRATYNAVIKLQQKYADEILKPLGLHYPTGVFAGRTRAHVNNLLAQVQ